MLEIFWVVFYIGYKNQLINEKSTIFIIIVVIIVTLKVLIQNSYFINT